MNRRSSSNLSSERRSLRHSPGQGSLNRQTTALSTASDSGIARHAEATDVDHTITEEIAEIKRYEVHFSFASLPFYQANHFTRISRR